MEGTGQHWPEWMGMECLGTCLDSRAAKSTARRSDRELWEHLTKRSDGGGVQDGYLAIYRKKVHDRLGVMSGTEPDDPADPD